MPKVSAEELMKLYRADRLVTHTVPPALIDKRPDHMQDLHSIMCGSILFNEGYHHKPDNNWVHNAVARFGDDSKETVFATLHDLHKIFDHHEELEKQKPEGHRGKGFIYFTNTDISDVAKRNGGDPHKNYMKATWGESPPVHCQRTRSFNFREFCVHTEPEDPDMVEGGAAWNELRAVLTQDNMVGLAYIYDSALDPKDHLGMAKRLRSNFNDEFVMIVFKLREPGGCTGDVLLKPLSGGPAKAAYEAGNSQCEEGEQPHDCEGGDEQYRLVLMDEFLQDLGIEGGHLTQH